MKLIETEMASGEFAAAQARIKRRIEQAAQKSNAIKLGLSGNPHATGAAYASFGWLEMRLLWESTNSYEAEKALKESINHAFSLGFRAQVMNSPSDAEDIPTVDQFFLFLMRK